MHDSRILSHENQSTLTDLFLKNQYPDPFKTITSKLIEQAHAIGVKVIVWTPDSKSDMMELIKTGINGITANRPDISLSLLKK